jgi:hypothetical protein
MVLNRDWKTALGGNMKEKKVSLKVLIFHDELKNLKLKEQGPKFSVHSLLAVPLILEEEGENTLSPLRKFPLYMLSETIGDLCKNLNFKGELHFKEIKNNEDWSKRDQASLDALRVVISALRHKGRKGAPESFEHPDIPPLFCRWGVLVYPQEKGYLSDIPKDEKEKALIHFEAFLRIALKGLLHYGFHGIRGHQFRVELLKLVLDGREHLHRDINRDRVLGKLADELKENISIATAYIEYVDSDHNKSDKPPLSRMIQVNDLLLGAARLFLDKLFEKEDPEDVWRFFDEVQEKYTLRPKFGTKIEGGKRALVAWPVVALIGKILERRERGSLKTSGHHRAFTISLVFSERGELKFYPYQDLVDLKRRLGGS